MTRYATLLDRIVPAHMVAIRRRVVLGVLTS